MNFALSLSDLAALLAMVLGTAGFAMSLMNYLRDRPRVEVSLKWDMVDPLTNQKMGVVRVTNVGRRPIYISVVCVRPPKGFENYLVPKQSLQGIKLSEGDAPSTFPVDYNKLAQFSKRWRELRAYAEDSAGGKYLSKKLPKSPVPSWAEK